MAPSIAVRNLAGTTSTSPLPRISSTRSWRCAPAGRAVGGARRSRCPPARRARRQRGGLLDLDEVSRPQLETAGNAYVADDADIGPVGPLLLLGHGAVADPQVRAGHACEPCAGGQGGELVGETSQQCCGQVFFLRGPGFVDGAGELAYARRVAPRARSSRPWWASQVDVGADNGRGKSARWASTDAETTDRTRAAGGDGTRMKRSNL